MNAAAVTAQAHPATPGGAASADVAAAHVWYGGLRRAFAAGRRSHGRRQYDAFLAAMRTRFPEKIQKAGDGGYRLRGDLIVDRGEWQGKTVAEVLSSSALRRIPQEVKRGSCARQARDRGRRLIHEWDGEFQREHPTLGSTTAAYFAEFERVYGPRVADYNQQHGTRLKLGRDAILRLRQRVAAEQPTDRWNASGRAARSYDDRLLAVVRSMALDPNFTPQQIIEEVERVARKLGAEAMPAWRVRRILKPGHPESIPWGARVLARQGPRRFGLDAVPAVTIDWSGVPAGSWLCGDCRVADVEVRVQDGRGGWKRMRPTVFGVSDQRSGLLRVLARENEHSSGILALYKAWLREFGGPDDLTLDNGEGYKRAFGSRRGSAWQRARLDTLPFGTICSVTRTRLHAALPYLARAKKLESLWRLLKTHNDRWYRSFRGGSPAERSYRAEQTPLMELPTLQEFEANLRVAVDRINATPRRALGGLTPNMIFEQYRGPVRKYDPDVVDLFCTPLDGPYRFGRDGVTYKPAGGQSHRYQPIEVEDLVKLQGTKVYIRPDLEETGLITFCRADGTPLCAGMAELLVGAGVSDEVSRRAHARAGRYRKIIRDAAQARDYLLENPTGQVLREQRAYVLAVEAELRQKAAPPPAPAIQIGGVEHVDEARRVRRQRDRALTRARRPAAAGASAAEQLAAAAGELPAAVGLDRAAALLEIATDNPDCETDRRRQIAERQAYFAAEAG